MVIRIFNYWTGELDKSWKQKFETKQPPRSWSMILVIHHCQKCSSFYSHRFGCCFHCLAKWWLFRKKKHFMIWFVMESIIIIIIMNVKFERKKMTWRKWQFGMCVYVLVSPDHRSISLNFIFHFFIIIINLSLFSLFLDVYCWPFFFFYYSGFTMMILLFEINIYDDDDMKCEWKYCNKKKKFTYLW